MRKLLILVIAVWFFNGCGLAQRQALMKEKYPYYPSEVKRAIDGGYVIEGMTQEQVYLAIGSTFCKSSSYFRGRSTVVWSFQPDPFTGKPSGGTYDCVRAVQRVYFENGRVVGWDNM